MRYNYYNRFYLFCLSAVLASGCAMNVSRSFSHNVSYAILNQSDPEIVRAGAPSFLILLDGFISDNPHSREPLRAAADLYNVYATVFVDDRERSKLLVNKSLDYARQALCKKHPQVCAEESKDIDTFKNNLDNIDTSELPYLYSLGSAWASWIQIHSQDWNAVADLPKVQAIMERIIVLDESFSWGRAHLYLAVLNSRFSSAMGGKPETGRMHFEKAIALSAGKDLIAKVEFADRYARLAFDQALHDQLVNDVLEADPVVENLTLSNSIAQQKARELQASSAEYFEE